MRVRQIAILLVEWVKFIQVMKEKWRMMNDEGWWFQAVDGFCRQTNGRTDICECRVAFATEKVYDFVVYGTQQFICLQQNWQCDPLY